MTLPSEPAARSLQGEELADVRQGVQPDRPEEKSLLQAAQEQALPGRKPKPAAIAKTRPELAEPREQPGSALVQPATHPVQQAPAAAATNRPAPAQQAPAGEATDRAASEKSKSQPELEAGHADRPTLAAAAAETAPVEAAPASDTSPPAPPVVTRKAVSPEQAVSRQPLPKGKPLPLAQPLRRVEPNPPPVSAPPPTPEVVRSHLMAGGWRFKTKPGESRATSDQISRAADSLERTGGGQPLDEAPRRTMEGLLGQDFSGVRIHRADLSPLNVQAASKGGDVYFDHGADDDFARPESLALLGHELTHVGQSGLAQTKPVADRPALPLARRPQRVTADEAEAEGVERSILSLARAGEGPLISGMPAMPLRAKEPGVQRFPEPAPSPGPSPVDYYSGATQNALEQFEAQPDENEPDFAELREALEEIIDDRLEKMMEMLGLDNEAEPAAPNLEGLARQVLPFLKRMIVVERERRA